MALRSQVAPFASKSLVIDWQEEPLEEGWIVEARYIDENGNVRSNPIVAFDPAMTTMRKASLSMPKAISRSTATSIPIGNSEIKFDGTSLDPTVFRRHL
ncbi:MAG: hypothetical protein R2838_26345 [Caldilineaceae bacterium]